MALINGSPNRTVYGTNSADQINVNGKAAAYGGSGNDTIFGSQFDNRLYGQDGSDTIFSNGGRDQVWGGRGDDTLSAAGPFESVKFYGEAGHDDITGSWSDDFLDGGDGNDTIRSFGGNDYVRGGPGDDTLYFIDDARFPGGGQFDAGAGYDTLHIYTGISPASPTVINIVGESQGNLQYDNGDSDSSRIRMNFTGTNKIVNDETSDGDRAIVFNGGGNSDTAVVGGSHNDVFIGGDGYDTFTGLGGSDSFVFKFDDVAEHAPRLAMGHDVITDYNLAEDHIAFQGGEGLMTTTQVEHDGMTTFTSTDLTGHVIHELDVIGVTGLSPISHDWIA